MQLCIAATYIAHISPRKSCFCDADRVFTVLVLYTLGGLIYSHVIGQYLRDDRPANGNTIGTT